jgi:putrescine:ornithine antiporter
MASVAVIQETAGVPRRKSRWVNFIAFVGSLYSLYVLYACGFTAMMYGAIITFAGWTLYGFVSKRFDLISSVTDRDI